MRDRTPARAILAPEQINQVADALMALTRELWTVCDRMIVLEEVLVRHGIDATAAIDGIDVDARLQARLDAQRDRLIGAVTSALAGEA